MESIQTIRKTTEIKPRHMNFDFEKIETPHWYNDNPILTTYFAAMSATFPDGEQMFIDAIRLFRDQISDPTLQAEIKGFIGQEGHHGHQHRKANRHLASLGIEVVAEEERFARLLKIITRSSSPAQRLAVTVAVEHMTAVFAEYILTYPEALEPFHPIVVELLNWHAVEEIEHKAVAFDVYMQCVGDRKLLKREMVRFLIGFHVFITFAQIQMLYKSRTLPKLRHFRGFYTFLLGKNGMIRKSRKSIVEFFSDDFHPWNTDNSHLTEEWKVNNRPLSEVESDAMSIMNNA